MTRTHRRILTLFFTISVLLSLALPARATVDLSPVASGARRRYAEGMIAWHLQNNDAVRQSLEAGYTALFFFEGCSDNMVSEILSDLSYYRVSAICVGICLDEEGEPYVSCFNSDASTLPDRPLDFEAWELDSVGAVGPATVLDGTYDVYSVYHGSYEALQLRSSYEDETIPALYMIPEGYEVSRAFAINIHTRTDNHILDTAMWSAGCLLVGAGDFDQFRQLVESLYYPHYERFQRDQYVGTVTIHRYPIREAMVSLYGSESAVDTILGDSPQQAPQSYLGRCMVTDVFEDSMTMEVITDTQLMSLPCSSSADVRSVPVTSLSPGDRIEVWQTLRNPRGELWYELHFSDGKCYLPAADAQEKPQSLLQIFWHYLFG